MQTVTPIALIREMDADELLGHLHHLGTAAQNDAHYTGAEIYNQVQAVKQQYRQLTGQQIAINTPGMSIAGAAMLVSCTT